MSGGPSDYLLLGKLLPRYLREVGGEKRRDKITVGTSALLSPILWAPGFLALPGSCELGALTDSTGDYKAQGLYPMDISSALPVFALNIDPSRDLKVLDLCCCPGGKLQMISEALSAGSLVVGVDVSANRLDVCRSLLRGWSSSYKAWCGGRHARQLIFCADGTRFGAAAPGELAFDSQVLDDECAGQRRRLNKSARERERKRLWLVQASLSIPRCRAVSTPVEGDVGGKGPEEQEQEREQKQEQEREQIDLDAFDLVLVDAECTHDASYRHMALLPQPAEPTHSDRAQSAKRRALSHGSTGAGDGGAVTASAQLTALQRGLLKNGFDRLVPGGTLVYSTCSQDEAQNEDVIRWLLECEPSAQLLDAEALLVTPVIASQSGESCDGAGMDLDLALQSLRTPVGELHQRVSASHPSAEQQSQLSVSICRALALQTSPLLCPSPSLPGTVRLDHTCGTSGHFLARIRKACV
ncbi:S-adenosyl-L-methionine-dependent methyltransferase [Ochromonadaceae sp. CCMP2298]|nr:S-adenosyl-L-methionine-dependent methyltransferase [Ochromonadaceae sp. CCMP2298]